MKRLPLLAASLLLVGAGCALFAPKPTVRNFAECEAQGYPIMESYPRQCRTPDGRTFVEEIPPQPEPVACTLEAKQCPDGSYVGRVPPTCEFAPCPPTVNGNVPPAVCKNTCGNGQCEEIVCLAVGCPCAETSKSCPQDCAQPQPQECRSYASCQDGQACPSGTECSGLPAYGCYPPGCPTPICLAEGTRIATPDGEVDVEALKAGTIVWSTDAQGARIAVPVLKTVKTPVAKHSVVHLLLDDGRELWLSPGHPTADGRTAGDLQKGDALDGAAVAAAEVEPYQDDATYDLLPAGDSGAYWANGILMGSTLR